MDETGKNKQTKETQKTKTHIGEEAKESGKGPKIVLLSDTVKERGQEGG